MAVVGSTDETTQFRINRGYRLLELLKQKEAEGYDVGVQVLLLYACVMGYFDDFNLLLTRFFK